MIAFFVKSKHLLFLWATAVTTVYCKICDVVRIKGVQMCAPALFVPGFGKCGTNALKTYSGFHPKMRWPIKSEIAFDPADISPEDLVKNHNPSVYPHDEYVWGVKDPAAAGKSAAGLARRLLQTYPSSKVIFLVCDPVWLPFRWFRHYVQRTLTWADSKRPASMLDLQKFVSSQFGLPSLVDVYYLSAPSQGRECERSRRDFQVLSAISSRFSIHGGWFQPTMCQAMYYVNQLAEYVRNFTMAGYEHGKSIEVLYMEGWEADGISMMHRVMQLLQLDEKIYKWRSTNNFRPVYSVHNDEGHAALPKTGLEDIESVSTSKIIVESVPGQCCQLLALSGQVPPWPECGDVARCLKPLSPPHLPPPIPSAPPQRPSPPPSRPSVPPPKSPSLTPKPPPPSSPKPPQSPPKPAAPPPKSPSLSPNPSVPPPKPPQSPPPPAVPPPKPPSLPPNPFVPPPKPPQSPPKPAAPPPKSPSLPPNPSVPPPKPPQSPPPTVPPPKPPSLPPNPFVPPPKPPQSPPKPAAPPPKSPSFPPNPSIPPPKPPQLPPRPAALPPKSPSLPPKSAVPPPKPPSFPSSPSVPPPKPPQLPPRPVLQPPKFLSLPANHFSSPSPPPMIPLLPALPLPNLPVQPLKTSQPPSKLSLRPPNPSVPLQTPFVPPQRPSVPSGGTHHQPPKKSSEPPPKLPVLPQQSSPPTHQLPHEQPQPSGPPDKQRYSPPKLHGPYLSPSLPASTLPLTPLLSPCLSPVGSLPRPPPPASYRPSSALPTRSSSSPPQIAPLSEKLPAVSHTPLSPAESKNILYVKLNASARASVSARDILVSSANQTIALVAGDGEKRRDHFDASASRWLIFALTTTTLACVVLYFQTRRSAMQKGCAQLRPGWRSMQLRDAPGMGRARVSPSNGFSSDALSMKYRSRFKRFQPGRADRRNEPSRFSSSESDNLVLSEFSHGASSSIKLNAPPRGEHQTIDSQVQ